MSFTSQNYAVGKQKRMDRVLIDCLFLTTAVALVMGSASYIFGTQILGIYTSNSEVIKSGLEIELTDTYKKPSILFAAVYPAMAIEPKELTDD